MLSQASPRVLRLLRLVRAFCHLSLTISLAVWMLASYTHPGHAQSNPAKKVAPGKGPRDNHAPGVGAFRTVDAAKLSPEQIKGLQFFVGYAAKGKKPNAWLEFEREISSTSELQASAKLVRKAGRSFALVSIPLGTPGIATRMSERRDRIWVSVEPGCELSFSSTTGRDEFYLDTEEGAGRSIKYCGATYAILTDPSNLGPSDFPLTVELHTEGHETVNRRQVPGRRLDTSGK